MSENTNQEPGLTEKPAMSVGKSVLLIAAAVALLVVIFGVVTREAPAVVEEIQVQTVAETAAQTSEESAAAAAEATAATTPADTGAEDPTCKGTYTVSDEEAAGAADEIIATMGDHQLTNSMMNVYYWMEVHNFLSYYGAYAAYFGLDYLEPLDTQACMVSEEGLTWQQYFVKTALESWQSYCAMAAEADTRGVLLSAERQQSFETMEAQLEEEAVAEGYENGDALIRNSLGAGASLKDYIAFVEHYYKANEMYNTLTAAVVPGEEELAAYFAEHAAEFEESGITVDSRSVDVRHILLFPEGADSTTVTTQEWPEEAWAAAEARAQELLTQWQENDPTEDSFAELANANSADTGSNTNGGLYEDIYEGEMVAAFNDWCFDATRTAGETGIVKTDFGYHVMYYVGSRLLWQESAREALVADAAGAEAAAIADRDPIQINWSAIRLANVVLG